MTGDSAVRFIAGIGTPWAKALGPWNLGLDSQLGNKIPDSPPPEWPNHQDPIMQRTYSIENALPTTNSTSEQLDNSHDTSVPALVANLAGALLAS